MAVETGWAAEHVFSIIINRPDARNAVNHDVAVGIEEALDKFEADQSAWVAILSGNGKNFSAGADLKEISAGKVNTLRTERGGFAGIVARKRTKPLIAAVHGPTLAGGCEIALACDLIVASRSAFFGVPEVKRSLVAGAGGLYRLPRILPRNVATELILTGDPISAERAYELGMVNALAEDSELSEVALAMAKRIAVNAPLAVQASLQVTRQANSGKSDEELLRMSQAALAELSQTQDFQEGPKAFLEKRAPRWIGA